eukprot:GHVN01082184.1.p2 GENE.GHVN01082184.1~~GHVN01082184.1.p2  ORF type:complete len:103 (-),score=0.59 GHVN01082184.1:2306-2587(-)
MYTLSSTAGQQFVKRSHTPEQQSSLLQPVGLEEWPSVQYDTSVPPNLVIPYRTLIRSAPVAVAATIKPDTSHPASLKGPVAATEAIVASAWHE